jgi:hypothetical protein
MEQETGSQVRFPPGENETKVFRKGIGFFGQNRF